MKKITSLLLVGFSTWGFSQFAVNIKSNPNFSPKEVYFYTTNGSKDILVSKEIKKNNQWNLSFPNSYTGMMKAYFPEINYSLNFISENKNVNISLNAEGNKVQEVVYLDTANQLMDELQSTQRKQENILPVLYQIKDFYRPSSDFYKALDKEILSLSGQELDFKGHSFIEYYNKNYNKFLVNSAKNPQPSQEEIVSFITNSNDYLETSTLLRPLLVSYLRNSGAKGAEKSIDELLASVNLETPRGQTVMSELIEIFDMYSMTQLKDKYLTEAKNLKCTITDRLASTIENNEKTNIGAKFSNYAFHSPINTKAKSIYDVKADKKIIVFWSSTCSHCETELPKFIPHYQEFKKNNIEIIGLSFDADKPSFEAKAKMYPWISDSELKGWYSSAAELYNVHATPSYFILDANNVIISKPNHFNDIIEYLGVK
ncbi:MAG: TlpA disulfide reductase family protein [Cruoricaptor ignavus]|nr:TlpA disulfide reductase family protein [Cruoricaptor ignavus]